MPNPRVTVLVLHSLGSDLMTQVPQGEKQLRRWDIKENRSAPGSLVEFKPPPVWNQYKWTILGISTAVALESLLIVALWLQRLRQKRMAARLVKSQCTVRDLTGRLVTAQEDERKRIARELHDDLSQRVASIGIFVSSLKRRVGPLAPEIYGSFEELQSHIVSLAAAVRQLASELHPHALGKLGVGPALAEQVGEFRSQTKIRAIFMTISTTVLFPRYCFMFVSCCSRSTP